VIPIEETPSNPVITDLFRRLEAQLGGLATNDRTTAEQLKAAADRCSADASKQATAQVAAQYALRAQRATELATAVSALQPYVLADLNGLMRLIPGDWRPLPSQA
jgi:hypothetical protein